MRSVSVRQSVTPAEVLRELTSMRRALYTAGHVAERMGIATAPVGRALDVLADRGLVVTERNGYHSEYRLVTRKERGAAVTLLDTGVLTGYDAFLMSVYNLNYPRPAKEGRCVDKRSLQLNELLKGTKNEREEGQGSTDAAPLGGDRPDGVPAKWHAHAPVSV
jgi:DNA-binding MarR family transcriptional regulator